MSARVCQFRPNKLDPQPLMFAFFYLVAFQWKPSDRKVETFNQIFPARYTSKNTPYWDDTGMTLGDCSPDSGSEERATVATERSHAIRRPLNRERPTPSRASLPASAREQWG